MQAVSQNVFAPDDEDLQAPNEKASRIATDGMMSDLMFIDLF